MSLNLGLTGQCRNAIGTVKIFDRDGYLRREIHILGDGKIIYREWDRNKNDMTFGWVDIVDPLEDR